MITFTKHPHWSAVKKICEQLHENGYVAWLAGGCVRDGLLGIVPQDFDVVTNATVTEIEQLFKKTIGVGKAFGVMRVVIPGADIEVATFRKDGIYEDGRHPTSVEEASPQEDAQRRDFTINALFFDPFNNEVKDFVEGKRDLKSRVIRAVGKAEDRFQEDHLRVMRAIRFVSQLDFNLEEKTQRAVSKLAAKVPEVSGERIHEELDKVMRGKRPDRAIRLLYETELLKSILPEIKYQNHWPVTFKKVIGSPNQETMGWVILLEGTPAIEREGVYSRLRFSKEQKATIDSAIRGIEKFRIFKDLKLAEKKELSANKNSILAIEFLDLTQPVSIQIKKFVQANPTLPKPWVGSSHLLELGIKPGKEMGMLLARVYEAQLSEVVSDQSAAIEWIKKKIKKVSDVSKV
jgi:tRNA nucleotidyltransferase (CCA-adding enzyme)